MVTEIDKIKSAIRNYGHPQNTKQFNDTTKHNTKQHNTTQHTTTCLCMLCV